MSNLELFMKGNKKQKTNGFFAATKSLVDPETGKPLNWEIKPISTKEDEAIRDACTHEVPIPGKRNQFRIKIDANAYMVKQVAASVVFPNLLDVWNKSCPAQWANANSAGWTAFKEMVKSILKESEEEPMTTAEKKEFDALKKQVEELKEKTGYFNYIDKNMNDSYKPTIQKLVDSGKLKGNENGELMLTNDMMRILTILDRCGIFD